MQMVFLENKVEVKKNYQFLGMYHDIPTVITISTGTDRPVQKAS